MDSRSPSRLGAATVLAAVLTVTAAGCGAASPDGPAVPTPATAAAGHAGSAAHAGATTSSAAVSLPAPGGPEPVGRADRVLVDRARADPWVPGVPRELAVTVWYPAARPADRPAPYVGPRLATELDRTATPGLGLAPGALDWAAIDTHAGAEAPAAATGGRRPVLLYSPGSGESRLQGSALAADLASHGFVVVAVDHTYETTVEFPDGLRHPRVDLQGADVSGTIARLSEIRVADLRFVLTRITTLAGEGGTAPDALPPGLAEAVDPTRVAAIGHSLGGDVAVAATRADPRVGAAVDLDGFLALDSQGERPTPAARDGLDRPFLLMGSRSAVDRLPAPGEEPAWVLRSHRQNPAWRSLWERSTAERFDVGAPAGRHHLFTDQASILPQLRRGDGPLEAETEQVGTMPDPARAVRSVHAHVRAFVDHVLRGADADLLTHGSPEHPDLAPVR